MAEREGKRTDERRGGVVCAGNFIVDRIHSLSYWPEQGNLTFIRHQDIGVGGGAINVATDLASMGFPGRLAAAGCVGADADGDFVRQRLLQAGEPDRAPRAGDVGNEIDAQRGGRGHEQSRLVCSPHDVEAETRNSIAAGMTVPRRCHCIRLADGPEYSLPRCLHGRRG